MKNVLFLVGSLQGGGAEKVLVDTVNSLDSAKYRITVQTLFDVGVHRYKLASSIRYKSIVSCKSRLMQKIMGKLLFFVFPTRVVYDFFVKDGYDFEIAFLEGLPTKIISKSTENKARKMAWIHTDLKSNPHSYKAYGSEEKERIAYNCFDKVFCVSKATEDAFLDKYGPTGAKVNTVYNVLDNVAIQTASREAVLLPTHIRPCMISVGRLVEQKGYDRLLRVHKKLVEEGLAHSLIIIGEGPLRGELEKYIADNNLQTTACLLEFQENPYKYMSKADAFICSSYTEGFSMAISESVICGTPVIATDVSGIREPAEAPRCSLVVENSERAIYEAMREILINPTILEEYRESLITTQIWNEKKNLIKTFEEKVFEEW